MSKPSAPKPIVLASWIVAVVVVAALTVVASGAAGSPRHRNSTRPAVSSSQPLSTAPTATAATRARAQARYAALPLAFEANEGQTDPQVKYMARGNGYKLFLTSSKAILSLPGRKGYSQVRDAMMNKRRGAAGVKAMMKKQSSKGRKASPVASLQMNFLGANPHSKLAAEDLQSGTVNYFLGNDPSKWHSNVPLYGQVSYRKIYPGIDLAFHGASQQLEFDYVVSPGADTAAIALGFQGAESVQTDAAGNLVLATSSGPVHVNKPIAYQSKNGAREYVDASFVLNAKNQVSFALGSYDHNRELVIDPTVTYSTYFGGTSADYGISVAVNASGDAFVAGATDSASILGTSTGAAGFDAFVTEIGPTGTLIFATYFGGTLDEFPGGIAVDSQGIYVSGTTGSSDFPVTGGAAQTVFQGGTTGGANDAFAVKMALNGTITWGTYIGGNGSDSGLGVAVDGSHNVYVVGETFSTNLGGGVVSPLPGGNALNRTSNTTADDGYIVKVNASGTSFGLVSYLGGSDGDLATGVAVNSTGTIFVTGETISSDLPTTAGVVQTTCGTDGNCNANATTAFDDGFVASIKANLSGYNYLTYYGGSDVDDAFAIAADASGNAYVTGTTASTDFPTTSGAFQSTQFGTQNAFLVQLNSTGTAASYSSYFGGNGSDLGLAIALDSSSPPNAYITGQSTSSSASFPLVNPTQAAGSGNSDAFVGVFGLSQGLVLFSTFLGGGGDEDQFEGGIALDSSHNIYITGDTDSGNGTTAAFPTLAALQGTYGGTGSCTDNIGNPVPCPDAFVAAYSPATAADFILSANSLSPSTVAPGGSATSTVTVTPLNAYAGTVNLTCAVTGGGSPAPTCSLNSSTLTVKTTGAVAALYRPSNMLYAMWLPVVGLSLIGMRFSTADSRRRKLLGFLLLGLVMGMLFFLPACGGGNGGGGGGGGCTGCTPAGGYTITVTGTDSVDANLAHAVALTLNVN